ncbi:MAG: hypothetical protein RBR86_02625 [Pseudobdellovibrionaceae bacterium]|jgi:hypothetical protein|nr:hypothetical protein [Pseudobdellovibrionaceae bacterium]
MQVAPVHRYPLEPSDVRDLKRLPFDTAAVAPLTTCAVPAVGPIYTKDGKLSDAAYVPHSLIHFTT